MEGEKWCQHLAAYSESERNSWVEALHMASYEYMRSQLLCLKEQIKSRGGVIDDGARDNAVVKDKFICKWNPQIHKT